MWTKENIDKQNNLGHLYDTLNQENLDNRMRKIKFSVYGRIEVLINLEKLEKLKSENWTWETLKDLERCRSLKITTMFQFRLLAI